MLDEIAHVLGEVEHHLGLGDDDCLLVQLAFGVRLLYGEAGLGASQRVDPLGEVCYRVCPGLEGLHYPLLLLLHLLDLAVQGTDCAGLLLKWAAQLLGDQFYGCLEVLGGEQFVQNDAKHLTVTPLGVDEGQFTSGDRLVLALGADVVFDSGFLGVLADKCVSAEAASEHAGEHVVAGDLPGVYHVPELAGQDLGG